MKVKFTEYYKESSTYRPIRQAEMETTPEAHHEAMKYLGFKEIRPGHFWKQTAYDHGETYDIISE